MHYLDNKVFDIIDARCNHEVQIILLLIRFLVFSNKYSLHERGLVQNFVWNFWNVDINLSCTNIRRKTLCGGRGAMYEIWV